MEASTRYLGLNPALQSDLFFGCMNSELQEFCLVVVKVGFVGGVGFCLCNVIYTCLFPCSWGILVFLLANASCDSLAIWPLTVPEHRDCNMNG